MLDPNLPADNSPLDSREMRNQFAAIQRHLDAPARPSRRLANLTPLPDQYGAPGEP